MGVISLKPPAEHSIITVKLISKDRSGAVSGDRSDIEGRPTESTRRHQGVDPSDTPIDVTGPITEEVRPTLSGVKKSISLHLQPLRTDLSWTGHSGS